MKRMLFSTVFLCLLSVGALSSAEQIRLKVFDMVESGGPAKYPDEKEKRQEECVKFCKEQSGRLNDYLSKGWIILHQPVEQNIKISPFKTNRPGVSDDGWCSCRGFEYVLSSPNP